MTDVNEIFEKTIEALGAADRGQKALTAKIASQKAEIESLRSVKNCSGSFRELVTKLASVGVVEDVQAVYLNDNVTDKNVNEFLVKLANVVSVRPTPMSPYEMSSIPVAEATKTGSDKDLDECNKKLQTLYNK